MFRIRTLRLGAAGIFAVASAVQAQPAPIAAKRDPVDAQAAVPRLAHESAFAQYRRLSDEKVTSWREANDTVLRAGGWRVYAREATQPDASTPATSSSPSPSPSTSTPRPAQPDKPAPAGHGGHKMN